MKLIRFFMSELGELIVCCVLAGCNVSDDCEYAL